MLASQKRAVQTYRRRLAERSLARYEVRGSTQDKELLRKLAKRLAMNDPAAAQLRAEIAEKLSDKSERRGGIWAALRQPPFGGSDLVVEREYTTGRDIDL
jgi:hypothetical protein